MYPCLLSSKTLSQQDIYSILKEHADFNKRRLRMDVFACCVGSVVTFVKQNPQRFYFQQPWAKQNTLSKQSMKSPPSVTLSFQSTSTSHANNVICKARDKAGCRVSEWQAQFDQDHPQYTDTTYWRLCSHC